MSYICPKPFKVSVGVVPTATVMQLLWVCRQYKSNRKYLLYPPLIRNILQHFVTQNRNIKGLQCQNT